MAPFLSGIILLATSIRKSPEPNKAPQAGKFQFQSGIIPRSPFSPKMSFPNIVPQQSLSYLVPALTKPFPIWYQRVVGWGSYFGLVVLDNPVLANTLTAADLQNIQTLMERGEWVLRLTDGLPQWSHAVLKPWVGRYYGALYFHSSWKWKC